MLILIQPLLYSTNTNTNTSLLATTEHSYCTPRAACFKPGARELARKSCKQRFIGGAQTLRSTSLAASAAWAAAWAAAEGVWQRSGTGSGGGSGNANDHGDDRIAGNVVWYGVVRPFSYLIFRNSQSRGWTNLNLVGCPQRP